MWVPVALQPRLSLPSSLPGGLTDAGKVNPLQFKGSLSSLAVNYLLCISQQQLNGINLLCSVFNKHHYHIASQDYANGRDKGERGPFLSPKSP